MFGRVLIYIVAASCIGGCKRAQNAPAKKRDPLVIAATVYALADVARQIGGDQVRVWWAAEAGQSLDGVQATPELRNRLRSADFVISGSGTTEPWAAEGFDDPYNARRVLRMDLLPAFTHAQRSDQGGDGFLWLDPRLMQDLCRELAERLTVARPEQAAMFRSRSADYVTQLAKLLDTYQSKSAMSQTKSMLVLGDDFNSLLWRFGLSPVEPIQANPTQLSNSDIGQIRQAADQQHTRLLLISADTPAIVSRDLGARAGVQIVPIDPLGSSAAGRRNNYLDLIRWDLDQILAASSVQ